MLFNLSDGRGWVYDFRQQFGQMCTPKQPENQLVVQQTPSAEGFFGRIPNLFGYPGIQKIARPDVENDVGAAVSDRSAPSGPMRRLGSPEWHEASDLASGRGVMNRRLSSNAERYGRAQAPEPPTGFLVTPEQVQDFVASMHAARIQSGKPCRPLCCDIKHN